MRELEEWIRSNIGDAREQRNEWPVQKDYYDGMLFAYGQILNSIYTGLIQKEKGVIIDAYFEGEKEWAYEYRGYMNNFDREEAERYYNETFNKELDEQKN